MRTGLRLHRGASAGKLVLDVDNRYASGASGESVARNKKYFEALDKQMQDGGLEKFLHVLMTRDISKFDTRRPPRTDALVEQIKEGFVGVERWWFNALEIGNIDLPSGHADHAVRRIWEKLAHQADRRTVRQLRKLAQR